MTETHVEKGDHGSGLPDGEAIALPEAWHVYHTQLNKGADLSRTSLPGVSLQDVNMDGDTAVDITVYDQRKAHPGKAMTLTWV